MRIQRVVLIQLNAALRAIALIVPFVSSSVPFLQISESLSQSLATVTPLVPPVEHHWGRVNLGFLAD